MSQSKVVDKSKNEISSISRVGRGFLPGMSQPADFVTFEVRRGGEVDFDSLDATLKEVFVSEMVPSKKSGDSAARNDIELAWRVLLVGRDLLQAVGLPAFDPGHIIAIDPAPGRGHAMRVRALFPSIEYVPTAVFSWTYRSACQIIELLTARPFDSQRFSDLLDRINSEFVKPSRQLLRPGESTVAVLKAAYRNGIPFRHLGMSIYRLGWGCRSRLVNRSAIEPDSAIGAAISQDKHMTARVLRDAGLPGAEHLMVNSEEDALKASEIIGWPVVVKPVNRERGEGVSVDIGDVSALREAFQKAVAFSTSVLIEKQVPGVCHRIFVARHEKIMFAAKRRPKSVKGDGEHSVSELIDRANQSEMKKAPWLRLKPFPQDELAVQCLAGAGLTWDSIPENEQYAPLRRIQSDAEGGVVESLTGEMHPANIDIALRAATLFGLDSAGIDFITEDIGQPWYDNGAIINEVNYASLLGGFRSRSGRGSTVDDFLGLFFHGLGRLPVEVFVGGEKAMDAALKRQGELVDDSLQCYMTSHNVTFRPDGSGMIFPEPSLFNRVLQLMADRDVEALILVVQTDELLHTGSPLDSLGTIFSIDSDLVDWEKPDQKLAVSTFQSLTALLGKLTARVRPVKPLKAS